MSPSASELVDWVIPIQGSDPSRFGTGFAIYQDDQKTYIVTCRHVIDEIGDEGGLLANFRKAYVVAYDMAEQGFDLAVLCVDESLDVPILSFATKVETGMSFQTAGFSLHGKLHQGESIQGIIGNKVQFISSHLEKRAKAWHLEIGRDSSLKRGFSGAPVLDSSNQVCGVINYKHSEGQRGSAISIEALADIWPDMPAALRASCTAQPMARQPQRKARVPLVNFDDELPAFEKIASREDTETQLITIYGASGTGKSRLLEEYELVSRKNNQNVLKIEFKTQITVEKFLDEIVYRLGLVHFKGYRSLRLEGRPSPFTHDREDEWYGNLTREVFMDLTDLASSNRLFLFLDVYEKADPVFKRWLTNGFLPGLVQQPLVVVIAGQEVPDHYPSWTGKQHFELHGLSIDNYRQCAEACGVTLQASEIQLLHTVLKGLPKQFVEYLEGQGTAV